MTSLVDVRAMAEEVVQVRPDWEMGSVLTVLLSCRDKGTSTQLRAAALRAARDPGTRAPVAITFASFWSPARSTNSFVPFRPLPECRHCATPARREADLQFCSGCGRVWEPVVFTVNRNKDRLEARPCPPNLRETLRGIA